MTTVTMNHEENFYTSSLPRRNRARRIPETQIKRGVLQAPGPAPPEYRNGVTDPMSHADFNLGVVWGPLGLGLLTGNARWRWEVLCGL